MIAPPPTRDEAQRALYEARKGETPRDFLASVPESFSATFREAVETLRKVNDPIERIDATEALLSEWVASGLVANGVDRASAGAGVESQPNVVSPDPKPVATPAPERRQRRHAPKSDCRAEHPREMRRRLEDVIVGRDGRIAARRGSPCFAMVPEWLAVRKAQLSAEGQGVAVAILELLGSDWYWARDQLLASWRSTREIAATLGVRQGTVVEAFQMLEREGILRRATEGDLALLANGGSPLPTHSQAIVWVLQEPGAWEPWAGRDAFVEIMRKRRAGRSS